jgi:hypothetical protein
MMGFFCQLLDAQIAPKSGHRVHFVLECAMIINMELNHFSYSHGPTQFPLPLFNFSLSVSAI